MPDERGSIVPDPDDYTLVFSDEFGGLSLDGERWNTALPWGPDITINDELQYYADVLGTDAVERSPFSFDGESLTIAATEVADAPATPEGERAAANGRSWLSGVLTTAGKFDFTYGYAEARIELPEGQGLWPSIWMLGAEPVGLRPQLYVMERDGGRPDSVFHNYEYVDADGNLRSPGQFEVVREGLSDGFHTVGVAWSPGGSCSCSTACRATPSRATTCRARTCTSCSVWRSAALGPARRTRAPRARRTGRSTTSGSGRDASPAESAGQSARERAGQSARSSTTNAPTRSPSSLRLTCRAVMPAARQRAAASPETPSSGLPSASWTRGSRAAGPRPARRCRAP